MNKSCSDHIILEFMNEADHISLNSGLGKYIRARYAFQSFSLSTSSATSSSKTLNNFKRRTSHLLCHQSQISSATLASITHTEPHQNVFITTGPRTTNPNDFDRANCTRADDAPQRKPRGPIRHSKLESPQYISSRATSARRTTLDRCRSSHEAEAAHKYKDSSQSGPFSTRAH